MQSEESDINNKAKSKMKMFEKDNKIWVENSLCTDINNFKDEPFFLAQVQSADFEKEIAIVKILVSKSIQAVKFSKCYPVLNDANLDEDNLQVSYELHQIDLINIIKNRFTKNKIFTYLSNSLIVANPYKKIESLFDDYEIEVYTDKIFNKNINYNIVYSDIPLYTPHIFGIAINAIKDLLTGVKNQVLVFSGEVSSGKSECFKQSLYCITSFFKKYKSIKNLEKQILSINTILEAFGNCKTIKNDNCTKIGKLLKIYVNDTNLNHEENFISYKKGNFDFLKNYYIIGCSLDAIFVEKTRVVNCPKNERNFNIFYQLIEGLSDYQLNVLSLKSRKAEDYNYLKETDCFFIDGVNDKASFDKTYDALSLFFKDDEITSIWKMVSASLLIGNLEFVDENAFSNDKINLTPESDSLLKNICAMLGIKKDDFEDSLTMTSRRIDDQEIFTPLKFYECIQMKNVIAKEVYNKLVNYIINKLSTVLKSNMLHNVKDKRESMNILNTHKYIGLLELFGFDNSENNSLEQLFYNYSYEKTRHLYIKDTFLGEQETYSKEGIMDFKINYYDNTEVINLIDKTSTGIFQNIEETCASKNDSRYFFLNISKLNTGNKKLKTNKMSNQVITVSHTIKDVEYEIEGFIIKNQEEIKPKLLLVLSNSSHDHIKFMFTNTLNEKEYNTELSMIKGMVNDPDKKIDKRTFIYKFRVELNNILNIIGRDKLIFINCIKPNDMKKKNAISTLYLHQQLKYLEVLEVIKMKQTGYSVKQFYHEFLDRFKVLSQNFYPIDSNKEMITFSVFTKRDQQVKLSELNKALAIETKKFIIFKSEEIRETKTKIYKLVVFKLYKTKNKKEITKKPKNILENKSFDSNYNPDKSVKDVIVSEHKFLETDNLCFPTDNENALSDSLCLLGNTKFFFKSNYYNELIKRYEEFILFESFAIEKVKGILLTYIRMKELFRMRRSSLIIQDIFREKRPMFLVKNMRKSSIKIQSHWKAILIRFSFLLMKQRTIQIQSYTRRYFLRKRILEEHQAACVINRKIKQHLYFKNFQMRLFCRRIFFYCFNTSWDKHISNIRNKMAVLIQSHYRKRLAIRKHFKIIMQANQKVHLISVYNSAVKIQAMYKRGIARMTFKLKKIFTVIIQTFFRSHLVRRRFLEIKNAAVIIQSCYIRRKIKNMTLSKIVNQNISSERKIQLLNYLKEHLFLFPFSNLSKILHQTQNIVNNNLTPQALKISLDFLVFRRKLKDNFDIIEESEVNYLSKEFSRYVTKIEEYCKKYNLIPISSIRKNYEKMTDETKYFHMDNSNYIDNNKLNNLKSLSLSPYSINSDLSNHNNQNKMNNTNNFNNSNYGNIYSNRLKDLTSIVSNNAYDSFNTSQRKEKTINNTTDYNITIKNTIEINNVKKSTNYNDYKKEYTMENRNLFSNYYEEARKKPKFSYWDDKCVEKIKKIEKENKILEQSVGLKEKTINNVPLLSLFSKILIYDSHVSSIEGGNKNFIEDYVYLEKVFIGMNTPIVQIVVGENHACVINSVGKCHSFGLNINGQMCSSELSYIKNSILLEDIKINNENEIFKEYESKAKDNKVKINKIIEEKDYYSSNSNKNTNTKYYMYKSNSNDNENSVIQSDKDKDKINFNDIIDKDHFFAALNYKGLTLKDLISPIIQDNYNINYFNKHPSILDNPNTKKEIKNVNPIVANTNRTNNTQFKKTINQDINDNYLNKLKNKIISKFRSDENCQIETKKIILTDKQTFILDTNKNIVVSGSNYYSELGLGYNSNEESNKVIENKLFYNKVIDISSNSNHFFCLVEENNKNKNTITNKSNDLFKILESSKENVNYLYGWSLKEKFNENIPLLIKIPNKIKIIQLSSGYKFTILLASNGSLFSFGESNKNGELGRITENSSNNNLTPQLIPKLYQHGVKVIYVTCGFKHVLAKTSFNKVVGWGNNQFGQLGIEKPPFVNTPIEISFAQLFINHSTKIFQIATGLNSSFFMTSLREIVYCGKVNNYADFNMKKYNCEFDNPELMSNRYQLIRINCCWTKMMSIFYVTIADTQSMINKGIKNNEIINIINHVADKWNNEDWKLPFLGKNNQYNKYFAHDIKSSV